MLAALIVAAGSSRRMGFDKLYAQLEGRPVVAHTISAFEQTKSVTDIVLIGREDRLDELRALVHRQRFTKVAAIIAGGDQRQDSVLAGLRQLGTRAEFVAVQDAARPLTTAALIEKVYAQCRTSGAAAGASPVTDTLKRAASNHVVTGSVERADLYAMQTPQIFARELLTRAYASVGEAGRAITDEVSAVQHLGEAVALVPHDDFNFKITYPRDLELAELVLRARRSGGKPS